jgi:hypothetical protein
MPGISWYARYQLVCEVSVGMPGISWYARYQAVCHVSVGMLGISWYAGYKLVCQVPVGLPGLLGSSVIRCRDIITTILCHQGSLLSCAIKDVPSCDFTTCLFHITFIRDFYLSRYLLVIIFFFFLLCI